MLASHLPRRACIVRSVVCSQPSVNYGYMLVEIDSKLGLDHHLIGLIMGNLPIRIMRAAAYSASNYTREVSLESLLGRGLASLP